MPGGTFFAAVPDKAAAARSAPRDGGRSGAGASGRRARPGRSGWPPGQGAAAGPGGVAAREPGGMQGDVSGYGGRHARGARRGRSRCRRRRGGRGRGGDPPPIGMLEAVRTGQVKESTITMAVGRILVQMDKFGLLDGKQKHTITEEDHAFNRPVLQKTAEEAATLLKNQDGVLPLTMATSTPRPSSVRPGASLVSVGQTGERAQGLPDHQEGPVAGARGDHGRQGALRGGERLRRHRRSRASALTGLVRNEHRHQGDAERQRGGLHADERPGAAGRHVVEVDGHADGSE